MSCHQLTFISISFCILGFWADLSKSITIKPCIFSCQVSSIQFDTILCVSLELSIDKGLISLCHYRQYFVDLEDTVPQKVSSQHYISQLIKSNGKVRTNDPLNKFLLKHVAMFYSDIPNYPTTGSCSKEQPKRSTFSPCWTTPEGTHSYFICIYFGGKSTILLFF